MRLALNFRRVDPSRGGAETYLVDLCRRLIHAGHQVDLFANAWKEGALPGAVGLHKVEARGLTRWQETWDFARNSEAALRADECRYDCTVGFINTWHQDVIIPQGGVHGGSLDANSRRFPAGLRRGLYRLGKQANPKAWVYHAIESRQYDPARKTRVVAVSHMVRGHLNRYHGVPDDRIDVVPNAIDAGRLAVADPSAARDRFRAEHGLAPDALVALFVGHNYRLKGLEPLLRSLALRMERDPDARPIHLLACGGGRPGPFRQLADRLGLGDSVKLLGFLPDIRPAFHAADCFVLPTYYDPCSLVVFEALACGLPVITTACNGAGELITGGREGFVVESPDAIGPLADALSAMADDEARRAMAVQAERLGREQTFDRHVASLIRVFERAAEERRGRGRVGRIPAPKSSARRPSTSPV
ncbi:glycosyltransferase family 4 protein [Tundrisphaera sp. TA3]|uniref:glycosyltransferase family 4 protein n=1 Tax=Tundrisphaera sp. TA3 TaxID=3435775 RepID=UPI003EBD8B7D